MSLIKDTLFKILLQSDFSVIIKFSQVSHEYKICQPNLSNYWILFWQLKTKYDFELDVPANENPYLFYLDNFIASKLNSWANKKIVTYQNYKTITSLNLNSSNLKEVSSLISQLVNLRELGLSNNKLEQLPATFGQLVNLQVLDLTNNKLTENQINLIRKNFPDTDVFG